MHVDALFIQFVLERREPFVGFFDDLRQVVREGAHLIGDRVRYQEADARERQEECEVDGEHG